MIGTIKWKWCDDAGKIHKHIIPNSYYVPHGKARLLSPQHWAKQQRGKLKKTTGEFTNAFKSKLQWGTDGKYTLSVPLSTDTNIATFNLAPGYKGYDLYCKEAAITQTEEDNNPMVDPSAFDDKEEERHVKTQTTSHNNNVWSSSNTD